jgi:hypothetical protein
MDHVGARAASGRLGNPGHGWLRRANKDGVLGSVTHCTVRLVWHEMLRSHADVALIVLGVIMFVAGSVILARPAAKRRSTLFALFGDVGSCGMRRGVLGTDQSDTLRDTRRECRSRFEAVVSEGLDRRFVAPVSCGRCRTNHSRRRCINCSWDTTMPGITEISA